MTDHCMTGAGAVALLIVRRKRSMPRVPALESLEVGMTVENHGSCMLARQQCVTID